MHTTIQTTTNPVNIETAPSSNVDLREQLFNEGQTGQFIEIQRSMDRVTNFRGALIDIDPTMLRSSTLIRNPHRPPEALYQETVMHWLRRHPTLAKV